MSTGLEDTAVSGEHLGDTHVSGERKLTSSGIEKGEALDRYVILNRLGAGGMGEVYAAWDPVLDRKVAVKVLRPDIEDTTITEELKHRLLGEAQALAKLSHPNVVTVHDVGLAGERVYLAMEFIEGRTLKEWLTQVPRPSWQQILEVFLAAGEGLVAAHDQGLTHRDFKPDNVLIGRDGRARVMDFGLAHGKAKTKKDGKPHRTITAPGAMVGTPAYMSPEALHGEPTDFRSDEFSFCVSLYEALYGFRPFEGNSPAAIAVEITANRVQPPPGNTRVPRRIHALILKGLRNAPNERFQNMRALLVQLGRTRVQKEQRVALAIIATLSVIAAGVTGLAMYKEHTRCDEVPLRLRGVWDENVKKAASESFTATGKSWAPAAWRDAAARLDAYAVAWVAERRAICESTPQGDDERFGEELVCLSRALSDFEATTQLFAHADADVVERAVSSASGLLPIESCKHPREAAVKTVVSDSDRARLSRIRAFIDAGKYNDALAQASSLAAEAGNNRDVFAEARLQGAIARRRLGDAPGADAWAEEAILAADEAHDDELAARAWVERVGFAAIATPAEADRWARFANAAIERAGASDELRAGLATNVGTVKYMLGDYAAAETAHRESLQLRVKMLGPSNPSVARAHSNLGATLAKLKRYDEARAEYVQALAIEEALLDSSHPQVADTLNNLGNVLREQGQLTRARDALTRSLSIKEAAYGADALPVAVTLSNLALTLLDLKELDDAEKALTRAVDIKQARAGADALTVAVTLTNLAELRRAQHKWADSAEADTRALSIRELRQGPTHPDLALNLNGLIEARTALKDASGVKRAREQLSTLSKK